MSALTADQRAAILKRYGGLVRTYFSQSELEEARFAYEPRLDATGVEFHDYLRLSIVLAAARQLPDILRRITLAPSLRQERVLVDTRGQIEGLLDVQAYLRRRGQLTTPRTFPNWRIQSSYITPENALAAAAARSVLAEVQVLTARLPMAGTREAQTIRRVTEVIERLLRDPALGEVLQLRLPDIASREAETLFARVGERWQTRRISNIAYFELSQWADTYRRKGLGEEGVVTGLAYSEGFDNRLFEIFALGAVRDGFKSLGFMERMVRPLHERGKSAVLEVEHPDSGLRISIFFQKGEDVVWTTTAPRDWPDVVGIPDIALVPRSTRHPVLIVDAKNRDQGSELEESVAEELYKMFGYFQNFSLRMRVDNHGPFGALIFLSTSGAGKIRRYVSRSGGLLISVTLDPTETLSEVTGRTSLMLQDLLRVAGLLGGQPDVAAELRNLKESVWKGVAVAELPASEEESLGQEVLNRIHDLVAARYGVPGEALLGARQDLELHLLGSIWAELDEDVQSLLATGEVFWAEHHLAIGMDFAPVVVEFSRAIEVIVNRLLFEPFRSWATKWNRPSGGTVLTLGQMRLMIQNAKDVAAGIPRKKEPVALNDFLNAHGMAGYAYKELLEDLDFVNKLRRRAAHKDMVSGVEGGQLRERILGVGAASPILATLVAKLTTLRSV